MYTELICDMNSDNIVCTGRPGIISHEIPKVSNKKSGYNYFNVTTAEITCFN